MPSSIASAARASAVSPAYPLFVALVLVTIAAACALAWVYPTFASHSALASALIRDVYLPELRPEPRERFVFVALATIVPLLSLWMTLCPTRTLGDRLALRAPILADALPLLACALLLFPLFESDFVATVMGTRAAVETHATLALSLSTCVSALWCWHAVRAKRHPRRKGHHAASLSVWAIFVSAMALQISWRVLGMGDITTGWEGATDLDASVYALSQVVAGKTLLVDLPSQYGLFPEMLAPLLRATGLTVFKLTCIFAAMQAISLLALFLTMSKTMRSRALLAAAGLALLTGTFGSWWYFANISDPYYQYWPVRFFWPAMSVWAFFHFSRKRTLARSQVVSAASAIAVLWNLDTGLFIVIAHAAYLCARLFARLVARKGDAYFGSQDPWSVRRYVCALAVHVFLVAVMVAAFLCWLRWKAHAPLHLAWMTQYQQVFYAAGFAMLPLPLQPHPWMSILGVYLLGLLSSMSGWRATPASSKPDLTFFLSMLGLGLFVYYQGRSHIFVLMCVYWPALMIAAMAADKALRAIRTHRLPPFGQIGIPAAAIAFILLSAASFLARAPEFGGDLMRRYARGSGPQDPIVRDEFAFIKAHSAPGQNCLVLSQRQGIYYAESGLASPLKGPGLVESILRQDEDRLLRAFARGRLACVFLGVGDKSQSSLPISLSDVGAAYDVAGTSPGGTMLYLRPKR